MSARLPIAILALTLGLGASAAERPRVALVLSGGGARGAAHVGVLRVLEEARVPVDVVVGTSMGSIVGGLYAAGMSPEELEGALVETDWKTVFTDRPPRDERYFRRKQDDAEFLVRYRVHFADGKPRLPMGLLQAQKLQNLLKYYEVTTTSVSDFDRLRIPYRAVAADLATGEAVVIDHGSLGTAMRASMSIPGVFPPVSFEGRLLVDGGVAQNLPVEVARTFDPDVVIAVDISTPLEGRPEPESYLGVIRRLTGFLTKGNVVRSKEDLREGDILIEPDLGDITVKDFDRADEAVAIGESAARAALPRLQALGVGETDWEAWRARQRREPAPLPVVTRVRVDNTSAVNDLIVLGHLRGQLGAPLDIERFNEDLSRLYGLGYFDPISFDVVPGPDGVTLEIHTRPAQTGLTTLQFGLQIEDDFSGGNTYTLASRLQRIAANRRAGEWRLDLSLGERSGVRAEFFQPFDARLRWFAAPAASYRRENLYLTFDGQRLAQVRITALAGELAFGRNLARWGQASVAVERVNLEGKVTVPEDLVVPPTEDRAGWRATLAYDTLDAVAWPRHGGRGALSYTERHRVLGGQTESATVSVRANWAWTVADTTFVPAAEVDLAVGAGSDDVEEFLLGGVFRLSGLAPNELIGTDAVLGRLVVYRELGRRTLSLLRPGWYVGGSLEAGNVFFRGEPIAMDRAITAGSLFVGADTVLGPVQIGWGLAEGGRSRVYLSIGRSYF